MQFDSLRILIVGSQTSEVLKTQKKVQTTSLNIDTVDICGTVKKAKKQLQSSDYHLMLLHLPFSKEAHLQPLTQLIKVTNKAAVMVCLQSEDEDFGLLTINEGADNYLTLNNITQKDLSQSIRSAIVRKSRCFFDEPPNEKPSLFRKLLNTANELVFIIDSIEGKLLDFNTTVVDQLGYSTSELLDMYFYDIEIQNQKDIRERIKALKTDKKRVKQGFFRKKNGGLIPIESNITFHKIGKAEYITILARDITERNRVDEVLKASEEKWKAIIEGSEGRILLLDRQLKIQYINKVPEGAQKQEMIGAPFHLFVKEHHQEMVREKVLKVLKTGKQESYEAETVSNNGDTIWYLTHINPVFIRGKLKYLSFYSANISESKKIQDDLKQSREIYKHIINHVPNLGILVFDEEMRYILAEGEPLENVGYLKENTEGKTIQEVLPKESVELLLPYYQKTFAGKQVDFERKFGNQTYNIRFKPLKNKKGKVSHGMIIALDITKEREFNQQLKNRIEKLDITNKKLEEFSYVATHDLKAPVVNLKGLIELFDEEELKKGNNYLYFEKIKESINRLHDTLEDLIDVVILNKKLEEQVTKLDFEKITKSVLYDFQEEMDKNSVTVKKNFSKVKTITYPRTHLMSILQNILSNAIKYRSEKRKSKITISTEKAGEYIELKIVDNGIGIDLRKDKSKIFQMFKRVTDQSEGKGLGLYIVKNQVEALGGKIKVASEPNLGTTFCVHLKSQ